jgi:exocyst complex protein 7
LFGIKPAADICNAFSSLTQRLALAAGETLDEFPEVVVKDNGKTFVPDGDVHPLTNYVLNYINSFFK